MAVFRDVIEAANYFKTWVNKRSAVEAITDERHTIPISPYIVRLTEIPDEDTGVVINGTPPGGAGSYSEEASQPTTSGEFLVNYLLGVVTFDETDETGDITADYSGWGSGKLAEEVNAVQKAIEHAFAPVFTAGESIAKFDIVHPRMNGADLEIYLSDAKSLTTVLDPYMATELMTPGGDVRCVNMGSVVNSDWAWSSANVGRYAFIAPGSPGQLTDVQPDIITSVTVSKPVGVIADSNRVCLRHSIPETKGQSILI